MYLDNNAIASLPSAMNTLAAPCRHFPEFNFMEKHPTLHPFVYLLYIPAPRPPFQIKFHQSRLSMM